MYLLMLNTPPLPIVYNLADCGVFMKRKEFSSPGVSLNSIDRELPFTFKLPNPLYLELTLHQYGPWCVVGGGFDRHVIWARLAPSGTNLRFLRSVFCSFWLGSVPIWLNWRPHLISMPWTRWSGMSDLVKKWVILAPDRTKPGLCQIRSKMYWNLSLKVPYLSFLGTIWPTLGQNLRFL